MKKSQRLHLALQAFGAAFPADNAPVAMQQLHDALKSVETRHSGLTDYDVRHGYAGKQLHLFPYSITSPFWKKEAATGNLICQLTSHYAVFWPGGEVAVFTRVGGRSGQLVFSKPHGFVAPNYAVSW